MKFSAIRFHGLFRAAGAAGLLAVACASPGTRVNPDGGGSGGSAGRGGTGGGAAGSGGGGQSGNNDAAASPDMRMVDAPEFDAPTPGFVWGDPFLPVDPTDKFGGSEDGSKKPRIVYPLDGSVHPINIKQIKLQWSQGRPARPMMMNDPQTYDLFRLRFVSARGTYDYYVPCLNAPECRYDMPSDKWLQMAGGNRDVEMTLTVTGTNRDGANGGAVSTSDPLKIRFSPNDVLGGLYYWSTSLSPPGAAKDGGGSLRLSFGTDKAVSYIPPSSPSNPHYCGGCHSVSRNGAVIAFTALGGQGILAASPTSDPTKHTISPAMRPNDASTMALNPDGTRALVSFNAELILRDTQNGNVLGKVPPASFPPMKSGYFPEWSPDGQNIVLMVSSKRNKVGPQNVVVDYDLGDGSIGILPFNGGSFGMARIIVPEDKDYHFYPSWSPDNQWIAFASAPVGKGGGGTESNTAGVDSNYNTPTARLRMVAAAGGQVYELTAATQGVGKTSTWPKFTPFVQELGSEKVYFVAFNSKIDYGWELKNAQLEASETVAIKKKFAARPQLWMFAVDTRKMASGDPSSAPIWLPFQGVDQKNHLPYWTEVISCSGGTQGGQCGDDEKCEGGVCRPK